MNKLLKRSYIQILVLLLVVLGVFSSCKKDDNDGPVAEYGVPSAKFAPMDQ